MTKHWNSIILWTSGQVKKSFSSKHFLKRQKIKHHKLAQLPFTHQEAGLPKNQSHESIYRPSDIHSSLNHQVFPVCQPKWALYHWNSPLHYQLLQHLYMQSNCVYSWIVLDSFLRYDCQQRSCLKLFHSTDVRTHMYVHLYIHLWLPWILSEIAYLSPLSNLKPQSPW